ncbi:MAG TPA: DUF58 domain-containing protein [Ohtaekwangia sp.]|uniref:DUF58 domain-containing protein n=1 Tax=Ohtaekwangia sp. TaxID=2066019 RepID=UPI002F94ACD9
MKKLAYYFSFIPFQLNFFVLLFVTASAYAIVHNKYSSLEEPTYFILLLKALVTFTGVVFIMMSGIALLTALLCWGYFWIYRRSHPGSPIQVTIGDGEKAQAGYVSLGLTAIGIIKPLLGHVKGRVIFADNRISAALPLDQPVFGDSRFIRSAIKAGRPVWIPDIKEHEVTKAVLYFEDMFRLFSFPFVLSNVQKLLTVPEESEAIAVDIHPDKTQEEVQRIQIPRKTRGELLNYKHFEAGDDIRRIVWKIYARNKELVVKIPETMDPYASHIYFHPSFYNTGLATGSIGNAMLNYYKVRIRQVYEALLRTEFSVKYIPDQESTTTIHESEEAETWLYQLSTSVWQSGKEAVDYMSARKEGIYCISSLIPLSEVEEICSNKTPDTLVILVKVSELWQNRSAFHWRSLFIKSDEHPLDVLKRKWLFSPGRKKILSNESQVQRYLEDQLFRTIVL